MVEAMLEIRQQLVEVRTQVSRGTISMTRRLPIFRSVSLCHSFFIRNGIVFVPFCKFIGSFWTNRYAQL